MSTLPDNNAATAVAEHRVELVEALDACPDLLGRHAEVRGEISHRANMVFMTMRQDDAQKVFFTLLDKFQIWKHEVNAGIF